MGAPLSPETATHQASQVEVEKFQRVSIRVKLYHWRVHICFPLQSNAPGHSSCVRRTLQLVRMSMMIVSMGTYVGQNIFLLSSHRILFSWQQNLCRGCETSWALSCASSNRLHKVLLLPETGLGWVDCQPYGLSCHYRIWQVPDDLQLHQLPPSM